MKLPPGWTLAPWRGQVDNVAYNGPRAGINLNDAFCHGHTIQNNCPSLRLFWLTPQKIATQLRARSCAVVGGRLIGGSVCPPAVLFNWVRETQEHSPGASLSLSANIHLGVLNNSYNRMCL